MTDHTPSPSTDRGRAIVDVRRLSRAALEARAVRLDRENLLLTEALNVTSRLHRKRRNEALDLRQALARALDQLRGRRAVAA